MISATKKILKGLRAHGCRVTQARTKIIDKLVEAKQPLTIQDLVTKTDTNETSVYRTISILGKIGLVEEIQTSGSRPRYSLHTEHHHHLVCQDCGLIVHVPCKAVAAPPLPKTFANIANHDVTFYGRCKQCA